MSLVGQITTALQAVGAAVKLKAPIASPTFTGVPAAPTAGAATNTTQIATTAHVFAERTNTATLTGKTIDGASNTITTSNADVIGKVLTGYSSGSGTVSATDTIVGAVGKLNGNAALLAPLASPTFTGVPAAPTATAATNTTQLATTAFVIAERANTATLTNKTLTAPAITSPTGIVKSDVGLGSADNTADTAKPVSTAQQTALNLKADLASPALTGNPTAPTQTAGNNSTRVATTAYADAKVADAIADAVTAIAPSQNAVFDALALKAPLASPALTGTPTAPTAAAATNSTQVATTAYADAKVADAIADAVTGIAPSQNAVFDALALKVTNVSGATGLWIGTVASLPGAGTANILYVTY